MHVLGLHLERRDELEECRPHVRSLLVTSVVDGGAELIVAVGVMT